MMQEEERWMTLKPQSLDLSLMAKKKPFRGKENVAYKGRSIPHKKPPQDMSSNKCDSGPKFFHCGRVGNIAKKCQKKKFDEGQKRYKQHAGHFADEE